MNHPHPTPALTIDGVTIKYGNKIVLDDFSLSINSEEIVSLLGPSGCGKTTLLKAIAGLENITAGEISIFGNSVQTVGHSLPTQKRGLGMVFQDNSLFPHLTVFQNVVFGISKGEQKSPQTHEKITDLLQSLNLLHLSDKYPHEISGGQQQRTSLARTIAPQPKLILMDEPFSGQDVDLKERIIESVLHLLQKEKITTLIVTHDQDEAFKISHRVGVIQEYRIEQLGSPKEIYHYPTTPFVANFIGRGAFIQAIYSKNKAINNWFTFKKRKNGNHIETQFNDGQQIWVHLRPEEVILSGERSGKVGVTGTIVRREFQSGNYLYRVRISDPSFPNEKDPTLYSLMPTDFEKNNGDRVSVHIIDKPHTFFVAPSPFML